MSLPEASNRWIIVTLLISLVGIFWLFKSFLISIIIGLLLAMMCSRLCSLLESKISHFKILKKYTSIISAGIITFVIAVLIVLPLIALLSYAISKINYHDLLNLKDQAINWFNNALKPEISTQIKSAFNGASAQDNFKKFSTITLSSLQKLSGSTLDLIMVIVFLFLFLWNRRAIAEFLEELSPIQPRILRHIKVEVTATLQVVFCSMLGLAIAQGLAFGILMLFFNYNAPVLGFAAGVCSLIPIFGTALVWVPVAISEFMAGNIISAIIIAIYGWLMMAVIIDNFLRIVLLKKISRSLQLKRPINEFLLFFAIASGISVIGFWGIILGPALVTLFLALSHVYVSLKQSKQSSKISMWDS